MTHSMIYSMAEW